MSDKLPQGIEGIKGLVGTAPHIGLRGTVALNIAHRL